MVWRDVSVAFIVADHKILLILRDDRPDISNPNRWGIIGGRIEDNESPEDCMRRECQEEISVLPQKFTYLGKIVANGKDANDYTKYFYFATLTPDEAANVQLKNEGQALRFFSPHELATVELTSNLARHYKKCKAEFDRMILEEVCPDSKALELSG